jgi:hypothetical protein
MEVMLLRTDDDTIDPSLEPMVEVIVPALDELPLIDRKASARSKTLPLNIALYEALCGVDGTVACTAGPKAAL